MAPKAPKKRALSPKTASLPQIKPQKTPKKGPFWPQFEGERRFLTPKGIKRGSLWSKTASLPQKGSKRLPKNPIFGGSVWPESSFELSALLTTRQRTSNLEVQLTFVNYRSDPSLSGDMPPQKWAQKGPFLGGQSGVTTPEPPSKIEEVQTLPQTDPPKMARKAPKPCIYARGANPDFLAIFGGSVWQGVLTQNDQNTPD